MRVADERAPGFSGEADESRLAYPGWSVAAGAGVGVFCAALVVVTFPVLLKPVATEFGWSREEVARAFGLAAAAGALCAGPLGARVDRNGVRSVALPSLVLFGCAFASLAWLRDLRQLYVTFVLLGVSGIGTSPVVYARAISSWFRERRGLALALGISGGALGGVLHPPLTEVLIARLGWRGACFALGFTLGPAIAMPLTLIGVHAPIVVAASLSAANLVFAWLRLAEPQRLESAGDAAADAPPEAARGPRFAAQLPRLV